MLWKRAATLTRLEEQRGPSGAVEGWRALTIDPGFGYVSACKRSFKQLVLERRIKNDV